MTERSARWPVSSLLAGLWLATTLALAGWWLVFGLAQARRLQAIGGDAAIALGHVQRMLVWEGLFLLALLVGGGIALIVAARREQTRRHTLQDFFSLFTHDLKTTLTSLQLQAESLQEDLGPQVGGASLRRLLHDTVRLQLQLENSLYYAEPDGRLFVEPVVLRACVAQMSADWPGLAVTINGDAEVMADRRALDGVVRNLLHNAVVHGGATDVLVDIAAKTGLARVTFSDNGRGAPPAIIRALERATARPALTSGTGLGLLISRRLVMRMRGSFGVSAGPATGFTVALTLPEAR